MASAYIDALKMLGRRELSEAQVRQRLARRAHPADAIARPQSWIKRRGRLRVRRKSGRAGSQPATARRAVDEVFAALDPDALLEASLAKRLRGREQIADQAELARLYRYLIGQGFEPDRVMAALGKIARVVE